MEWREHYESLGLCENYDSDSDFKDKFYRQLEMTVNERQIFQFRGRGVNSGLEMEESESTILQLSDTAKKILKKVSHNQGTIRYYYRDNEPCIRIGGDRFGYIMPNRNPRTLAQWRAAVRELREADLLEDEGDQGHTFLMTPRGYEVADMIEGTT